MPKSASPILVNGGAICESSPCEAQVDYAQDKGMILIGFLLYRSHDVVERPGYRIDSRTIKRGSRPSILIVSFVES